MDLEELAEERATRSAAKMKWWKRRGSGVGGGVGGGDAFGRWIGLCDPAAQFTVDTV